MSPDISVIIPTWNSAATLETAILSALNQTHVPLEVLVCDDGSSDDSADRVKVIKDPRVRWISGNRGGRPAIPRNRGIKESKGEWLAFLDSDDEWLPQKLEKQLAQAAELNCMAVSTNAVRLVPVRGAVGNLLNWEQERVSFDDLLKVNQVVCSSAIVHRSIIGIVAGFPEALELRALEDWACWLRVATQTDFAYVKDPLVIYRDDPSSSLRRGGPDFWTQRKLVFGDFLKWANKQKRADKSLGVYRTKVKQQRRNDQRQRWNDSKQGWREAWRARRGLS